MQYKVLKSVSGIYTVRNENNETLEIPASGKLRYLEQSPIVGDNVIVENGVIVNILPRENFFIRPKVANIDQMIVFMSIEKPKFQSFLVDKYFAIIESKNIEPVLFITKSDLNPEEANQIASLYRGMKYHVELIDNVSGYNHNHLIDIFTGKYSVFMGQSGVGKTTTINALGNHSFSTQEISKALGRGKHTTRVVSIIDFNGGYLIDTPGFSSLTLDLSKEQLSKSFKIFRELSKSCKFRNCLHYNENIDNCAIKQNIGTKLIPQIRYNNYIKLLDELSKGER
ncbi:ribosome small subunit-dependent GTPase A [Mycoplasmopsis verecunda]|uniref:Small ribosomal subunit biogenesis GTPase RsgA n=1 Tax=Mycoplasmopsis verecunda TaxID=171291 RepID=A0A1T4KTI3_9BACT|nr:ribosome small subunit-dependent GTPase A [Mycoplasmopsis verecunda]WPB54661.1 ribosome small subunit-dependent GTPase A [Mycoplasmopsis verecunda]SJZ45627.1 ribosome biogenesis GTPase [Mycoplasmopsis verecunda]